MNELTKAAQDVLAERARQVSAEGWTPEHDDEHKHGELARAAAFYSLCAEGPPKPGVPHEIHQTRRWDFNILAAIWPRSWNWPTPKDRRRNLVRAAALLLAEIERSDRADAEREERRADALREAARPNGVAPAARRCPYCDETGLVHRADGECLGICTCPAGTPTDDAAGARRYRLLRDSYTPHTLHKLAAMDGAAWDSFIDSNSAAGGVTGKSA
jgi:hypothetical protein